MEKLFIFGAVASALLEPDSVAAAVCGRRSSDLPAAFIISPKALHRLADGSDGDQCEGRGENSALRRTAPRWVMRPSSLQPPEVLFVLVFLLV